VVTTTSVMDVQRELRERRFDLVIVDFHMPGMNGDEALEQIKSAPIQGTPLFYLHTTDLTVGAMDVALGFDGALVAKGNADLLATQVDAIAKQLVVQAP